MSFFSETTIQRYVMALTQGKPKVKIQYKFGAWWKCYLYETTCSDFI